MHLPKPSIRTNPDVKYGGMVKDLQKVLSHPKYIAYMDEAEESVMHTEGLMFEGVMAIGATLVSMVVVIRLIVWNIYTMRTKVSDKLKATDEYLEKNVQRLANTDNKDKDKIIKKQKGAIQGLNKASELLRIKLDDEEVTKPKTIKKNPSSDDNTGDDDDDFVL